MGRRGRSIFGDEGHVFFLTTTVVEFVRVFSCGPQYYDILVNSLDFVLKEHRGLLRAYVFMPSHVHLVVEMPAGESISDLMRDFKKFTSTKVRQGLQREERSEFLQVLRRNAVGKKNQVFKLWMDRFDDVVIHDDEMMAVKVDYIHNNPVKAGLVAAAEDWDYSSARDYRGMGHGPLSVATDWFTATEEPAKGSNSGLVSGANS
jgi:REP element-mobilizing transposase RayT